MPKSVYDAEQPPAAAIKAPKVYQVAQVVVVAPVAPAETPEGPLAVAGSPVEGAPPATAKPRRRRDPMRQPTLLQHVVFEPAPARVAADRLIGAADVDALDAVDAKQLREALAVLDAELRRIARCQEAARSLDLHLTQLRIGKFDR